MSRDYLVFVLSFRVSGTYIVTNKKLTTQLYTITELIISKAIIRINLKMGDRNFKPALVTPLIEHSKLVGI